jgi:hypothetical protein
VIKGYAPSKSQRSKFYKVLSKEGIYEAHNISKRYYRRDKVILRKLFEKFEEKRMWK